MLDERNQSRAIGTSKWESRSRAEIYLGRYKDHVGNITLVLNLRTGYISPQFYLVFNGIFSIAPYLNSFNTPPN